MKKENRLPFAFVVFYWLRGLRRDKTQKITVEMVKGFWS